MPQRKDFYFKEKCAGKSFFCENNSPQAKCAAGKIFLIELNDVAFITSSKKV